MTNSDSLPNYGRRYRAGRRISSAFVESAVNQLIDKSMSKSQRIRWDPRSAPLLLQALVHVIDGQLRDDFARWYRGFPSNASAMPLAALPHHLNRSHPEQAQVDWGQLTVRLGGVPTMVPCSPAVAKRWLISSWASAATP
ncbi:MAG: hypothetical protein EOP82_16430 [Variovorax sp.]|nr:MAG: hypothetical protein EOP82_16430 [Variovorax sp.]